ncbi:hypothetical protein VTJ83DRAFT_5320 [Remersonia thermophila]|uniref:Uncharacterized protein n=1 Tax=Remersonia thermophila TaxID=72144 RepID=A0ABR4D6H7_9PEZI
MASHLTLVPTIDRPNSRVSLARSDTTYHSFQDDSDIQEPGVLSGQQPPSSVCPRPASAIPEEETKQPSAPEMRRQDSGYESMAPRSSTSSHHPKYASASSPSLSSSTRKRRSRPAAQRASHSGPVAHRPRGHLHRTSAPPPASSASPSTQQPHQPVTYFHFPHFTSSDPALVEPEPSASVGALYEAKGSTSVSVFPLPTRSESPTYPLPPQTTHYWTSDSTRRLEYAAIDAASKGVKGWVIRHVVPDCFIPESKRRIGFEDDRGSVVRYRLSLEADESAAPEKDRSGRPAKGWRAWWLRRRTG